MSKQVKDYSENTSPASNDWFLMQPNAGGLYKKVQRSNIVGSPVSDAISAASIKTTAQLTDYVLALDNTGALYKITVLNLLATSLVVPVSVSLLHFDGTNGATTTTDAKGNTVTLTNATISTAQSKFGGSSLALNGSSGYCNIASSTNFNFGTSNITIEFWVYPNTNSGQQTLLERRGTGFGSGDWVVWYCSSGTNRISMISYDADGVGNDFVSTSSGDLPSGQWSHVAITRNNNVWTIWVNGVSKGSATKSFTFASSTQPITIGRDNSSGGRFYFNGYIDEFRIINNIAVYTATFTPPSSAFS